MAAAGHPVYITFLFGTVSSTGTVNVDTPVTPNDSWSKTVGGKVKRLARLLDLRYRSKKELLFDHSIQMKNYKLQLQLHDTDHANRIIGVYEKHRNNDKDWGESEHTCN